MAVLIACGYLSWDWSVYHNDGESSCHQVGFLTAFLGDPVGSVESLDAPDQQWYISAEHPQKF